MSLIKGWHNTRLRYDDCNQLDEIAIRALITVNNEEAVYGEFI